MTHRGLQTVNGPQLLADLLCVSPERPAFDTVLVLNINKRKVSAECPEVGDGSWHTLNGSAEVTSRVTAGRGDTRYLPYSILRNLPPGGSSADSDSGRSCQSSSATHGQAADFRSYASSVPLMGATH